MSTALLATASAFWLGVLTSISPCPLATNLAAISYVGRSAGQSSRVLLAGLLYALGRTVAYVVLASLLVASLLSSPRVAMWLQQHMNQFLGPLLVLIAMVLLGLLDYGVSGRGVTEQLRQRVDRWGLVGAGLLGLLFAVSFCPVSAALFFGSLLPLAVERQSTVVLPTVFGVGTALPVLLFAILLAAGAKSVGAVFQQLTRFEWWARQATGVTLLLIGLYLTLHHVFRMF